MKKAGDRDEELRSIANRIETDAYELAGWEQSEIILRDMRKEDTGGVHTHEPAVIREHLQRVVRSSGQSQFLAERILDADAYPSLITEELRAKATRLLARIRAAEEIDELDPDSEIKALSSAMKTRMRALGINSAHAGRLLDEASLLEESAQPKLIAGR